jgi:methionyl-tRNA formyltransferase
MRIVLIGEESAGLHVLRWLLTTEHELVAVLAGGDPRSGSPVAVTAERAGIRVRPAELVHDPAFAGWLEGEGADLLLNVHSLYRIRENVLRAPAIGAFNLHPGPLPRYAGLNAPSWAIYCGETHHGSTVHWMTSEIDAGDIAYQQSVEITPSDTGLSLSVKCIRAGVPLVAKVVEAATSGRSGIPRIAQDLRQRTYFGPGPPNGGRLSWSGPARKVVDFVRAADYFPFASPWGHPRSVIGDRDLEITKASLTGKTTRGAPPGTVRGSHGDGVLVAAADEWVLLERVRVSGAAIVPENILRETTSFDA